MLKNRKHLLYYAWVIGLDQLIVATGNAHKVREIRHKLSGAFSEIISMKEAGITCDVIEDGDTFCDNAAKKAREIGLLAGCAVLSDDSGLVVEALGGAPGVHSARYAGGHDDAQNLALLLANLKNMPHPRKAWFVSACALWRPEAGMLMTVGTCQGSILYEPRGGNGFGYDPVFYDETLGLSFSEIPLETKNAISHRARALDALMRLLKT